MASPAPRATLEQWRVLREIVQTGSYARAAEKLHKSQSTITYAIQRLEFQLDVKIFTMQGRRAVLTDVGKVLYRRAMQLLEEAAALEKAAAELAQGWEPEIRLAADIAYPTWMLLECLDRFSSQRPTTRIELYETVLGGTSQALLEKQVDLAISPIVPQGFVGDPLISLKFIAVAAPRHPLHQGDEPLEYTDLQRHRQLVIRDSGPKRQHDAGWLGAEARWTVSHKATSIRAACMGLGFAWYPEAMIRKELASGALKPLNLRKGALRYAQLYLVIAEPEYAGPGIRLLADLLQQSDSPDPSGDKPDKPYTPGSTPANPDKAPDDSATATAANTP